MTITMRDDRTLVCSGLCAGAEGEHLATTLEFALPASADGWSARAEFGLPDGSGAFLPLQNSAVALPYSLTRKGPLRLQLVLEGPGGEIMKSRVLRLDVSESLCALEQAAEDTPGGFDGIVKSLAQQVTASLPPGPRGEKGDKGDTGGKGDKGDKGDTGAQGPAGLGSAAPGGYYIVTTETELQDALYDCGNLGYGYVKLIGEISSDIFISYPNITIDGYGARYNGLVTLSDAAGENSLIGLCGVIDIYCEASCRISGCSIDGNISAYIYGGGQATIIGNVVTGDIGVDSYAQSMILGNNAREVYCYYGISDSNNVRDYS